MDLKKTFAKLLATLSRYRDEKFTGQITVHVGLESDRGFGNGTAIPDGVNDHAVGKAVIGHTEPRALTIAQKVTIGQGGSLADDRGIVTCNCVVITAAVNCLPAGVDRGGNLLFHEWTRFDNASG